MIGTRASTKLVAALAGAAALLAACGGGGGGDSSDGGRKVTFTGTLPAPAAGALTTGLDASSVTRVVVFDLDGHVSVANLNGGNFSVEVATGKPAGLIFVGASDDFLGFLTLGAGIDSLPLASVAEGVTTIDLQTLAATGTVVEPGYNPLGTEIPLTPAEQATLAQFNAFFASVIQNPDVDGNGVVDILEGRLYRLWVMYGVTPIGFGGNLTPDLTGSVTIEHFNMSFSSNDPADEGPCSVTGPAGSGLTATPCAAQQLLGPPGGVEYSLYENLGASPIPVPVAGTYAFSTSSGKTLTFTVPDQSLAYSRILIPTPTVTVVDGKISRIDWVYRNAGDATAQAGAALLDAVFVQVNRPLGTLVYNAQLSGGTTSHALTTPGIPWDGQIVIALPYRDVFGNTYVVTFENY